MARIKLTQDKYAIVDDEDFEWLNQWKWYFDGNYASRKTPKKLYMHRVINQTPGDQLTDHINRDGLDNRKSNLRTVNHSKNALNSKMFSHNTSGHTGVTWNKNKNKWQSQIKINQEYRYLGLFTTLKEAVKARKEAEIYYATI